MLHTLQRWQLWYDPVYGKRFTTLWFGPYDMDHMIWTISYGSYQMAHMRWFMWDGPYHMDHTVWFILYEYEKAYIWAILLDCVANKIAIKKFSFSYKKEWMVIQLVRCGYQSYIAKNSGSLKGLLCLVDLISALKDFKIDCIN